MPFRILVGLPSYNEADTIAKVTLDVDTAIATLPFPADALLVNADNASTDGTAAAFMAASTKHAKTVITTGHRAGKGANWRAVLELVRDHRANAVLFVDTDLAAVPESWVHALLLAVRGRADFCFPLRPPTWNGGDLTYQLAYPLLAGAFGADLREPLCGDIALSAGAAQDILRQEWIAEEERFGVDFLVASVAATRSWKSVTLPIRRRNKLRSFAPGPDGGYRMGGKFAEVSAAVRHRVALRLHQPPPTRWHPCAAATPVDPKFVVPRHDTDIAELAASTTRRLQADARSGALAVFPAPLADQLTEHVTSGAARNGLDWPLWQQCVFAWIAGHTCPDRAVVPVDLFETLFLNRVVGHHSEIAGTAGWYSTVREQARDVFAHRRALWAGT